MSHFPTNMSHINSMLMFAVCFDSPTDVYVPYLAAAEDEKEGSQNPQCEYSQSLKWSNQSGNQSTNQ